MASLFPLLPAFLDLTGRAAVLLSGGVMLAPLAGRLLDCGASVTVFDKAPAPQMAALAPAARLVARRWRTLDFAGAALVVAGADEPRLSRARAAARTARALFYAPHDLGASDIALGASVADGALAIGATASGLPVEVGQAVARRIEASMLAGYGGFLHATVRAASRVERMLPEPNARAAFWRACAEAALDMNSATSTNWDDWIVTRLDATREDLSGN